MGVYARFLISTPFPWKFFDDFDDYYLMEKDSLMLIAFSTSPASTIYHHSDVIMSAMASQITGVSIVRSVVGSGADQRKHQSSASLAFVRGIPRWSVNSPHKIPVTRKMFPFDETSWKPAMGPAGAEVNTYLAIIVLFSVVAIWVPTVSHT